MTSTVRRSERTLSVRDLTSSASAPVATVFANLMPAEVTAKRRLGWLRRRLLFALVALTLLVGLAYALVHQQTAGSEDDLAAAQARTAQLNAKTLEFGKLTTLQAEIGGIQGQLASVMAGDLQWSALTTTLNARAPRGLTVTGVHGTIDTEASTDAVTPGTVQPVGTLEVSGTATDYRAVATFVEALSKVPGLQQVDPGSVTTAPGSLTFDVTASLTEAALGGRFTPTTSAPSPTGGSR